MVSAENTYLHLLSVMKKLGGINLQQAMERGQMVLIDTTSQPFDSNSFGNLPISTAVPNTFSLTMPSQVIKSVNSSNEDEDQTQLSKNMSSLFEKVVDAVGKFSGEK